MVKKAAAAAAQKPEPAPAPAPALDAAAPEAPGAPPAEQPAAQPVAEVAQTPEQPAETPPAAVAKPEAAAPAPDLDDFIARHERAAQDVDLVVTAISHPDAKPGHRIGVYSGFPITAGPLEATYSDGSKH